MDDKSSKSQNSLPGSGRFTPQAETAEDVLKGQTVGLVNLNDFRKRRAEVLDRRERGDLANSSGACTPTDGTSTPNTVFKKKRKAASKGKLSFAADDEESNTSNDLRVVTPHERTHVNSSAVSSEADGKLVKKKLGANSSLGLKPRVMTKNALQREAQQAELARQDFVVMRKAVKATDVIIPFVFYDGTNIPGGRCRIKKGEQIWLLLDKARKVGAELGVGGDRGRREWARVSVDDLMLVRGEVILPHHYDIYHFLFNKVEGFDKPLFDYSAQPTKATPALLEAEELPATFDPLTSHLKRRKEDQSCPDEELEGFADDANMTRVVDRRWYERNKHIFPASAWTEYAPDRDLSKVQRKDAEGNAFFFS